MARTRAAAAKLTSTEPVNVNQEVESLATEEHTEAEASESPIHSEETENMPPKTFNGKLQQFGFTSSTKASVGTAAVGSLPAKGRLKRKLPLREDADFAIRSPSPSKKRRSPSKYAPPSKYAHLPLLTDILEPNLIAVFIGNNPGIRTATAGHAYAHPSNLFWRLLHSSGCTDRRLKPEEDVDLPRLYSLGNTNIVERPTKDAAELSKAEMAAGTAALEEKVRRYKPEAVCIVGKGIWEAIWRWRYGKNPTAAQFKYGWQDEKENMGKSEGEVEELDAEGKVWRGAKVFVTTSTSGLSASTRPAEKEAIWRPFGEWVEKRRAERLTLQASKAE
ncbi:hypothetical protein W97_08256 [Coniosporium apollinis CBS 100218]|uniref:Uracil-DNA glycosylase-like domain-containing protein n=1 Tax=Coniosporium apollinis (strain CBS 100218) TaxID=1168221 RepID=R7Z4G8_CONA1|nr:uncharacterized protein W97_08256 [Coniosporium apollinis CBS 100218]EON68998.1 hypothetical protein W97_08256 [Coniosporium apollinis CBS 100218]